jgi:hypothetical protein
MITRRAALTRALPLFTLALALAACGELRWQKAGGDDAGLTRDLAACRSQAQDRFGGAANIGLPPTTDPRFGPVGPSQADLQMQQSQAVGTCMRGKGYVLVPVEK